MHYRSKRKQLSKEGSLSATWLFMPFSMFCLKLGTMGCILNVTGCIIIDMALCVKRMSCLLNTFLWRGDMLKNFSVTLGTAAVAFFRL